MTQTPSIGRIVHYRLRAADDETVGAAVVPAIITCVHSERVVDLTIFLPDAPPRPRISVELDDDGQPGIGRWFWPPRNDGLHVRKLGQTASDGGVGGAAAGTSG